MDWNFEQSRVFVQFLSLSFFFSSFFFVIKKLVALEWFSERVWRL